jgi:hypothetical protein
MGRFYGFVSYGFRTDVISNSTISDYDFSFIGSNPQRAALSFNVTGDSGTTGFCRVDVPKPLINGSFTVKLDGQLLMEPQYRILPASNENYTYIYINYTQSQHQIEITGTTTIPEFPSSLILPLLMLVTLFGVVAHKMRQLESLRRVEKGKLCGR